MIRGEEAAALVHFLFLFSLSRGRYSVVETAVHQRTSDGLKLHPYSLGVADTAVLSK